MTLLRILGLLSAFIWLCLFIGTWFGAEATKAIEGALR